MGDVSVEDAKSRVLAEAQGYYQGINFKLAPWPSSAKQVAEAASLQLALCETEDLAKAVVAYSDDSDPTSPMPRGFQNAIFAVTATPSALSNATDRAKRLLAAELIEKDHKSGDSAKLVRDQLKRIIPQLTREFAIQTRRAFDRVVLPGGSVAVSTGSFSLKRFLTILRGIWFIQRSVSTSHSAVMKPAKSTLRSS